MRDIYQEITNRILADLEKGVLPWRKPWQSGQPSGLPLRSTGQPYSGINITILWSAACDKGYRSRYWFTFKQALEHGGNVRKGEKSEAIVYASTFQKKAKDDKGETFVETIPFLKQYNVFNAEQCDGLPEHFLAPPLLRDPLPVEQRIAHADEFCSATGANIRPGHDRAYYSPMLDYIGMPEFASFVSAEAYYATLIHELTHWTGPSTRLARPAIANGAARFGSEDYAQEELIAEMGSAFLLAELGLAPAVREDHAHYIGSWLKKLRDDKRAVVKAASAASKAAEYLRMKAGMAASAEDVEAEQAAA